MTVSSASSYAEAQSPKNTEDVLIERVVRFFRQEVMLALWEDVCRQVIHLKGILPNVSKKIEPLASLDETVESGRPCLETMSSISLEGPHGCVKLNSS